MTYLKRICGLALVGIAVVMAAGATSASATVLDCNGSPCDPHGTIHIEIEYSLEDPEPIFVHMPIGAIECTGETYHYTIANPGSSVDTPSLPLLALNTSNCNATVTTLAKGTWQIHTSGSANNGTITSTGTETTIEFVGFHCIFKTSNTDLGTLTGSATTKSKATVDLSGTLPRTGGRSGAFCGSTAAITGSLSVTSPTSLNVT